MLESLDMRNDTAEEIIRHYRDVIGQIRACNQELVDYPGAVTHYEVSMRLPDSGLEVDLEIRNFDEAHGVNNPFQFVVADFDENITDTILELSYDEIGVWMRDNLGEEAYQEGLNPVFDPDAAETRLTMSIESGDRVYGKDLTENIMKEIDQVYSDMSY